MDYCWVIVLKLSVPFSNMGSERNINLIPLIGSFDEEGRLNLGEIILNVLIFVPLGVYAGVLFRRWIFAKKVFLFFLISLLCEVYQYFLRVGVCDITDLINNTIGGIIGLLIYTGIVKAFNDSVKAQKFINIIAGT